MASIPLPALDIQTPNVIGQAGQVLQLQNQQGQQKLQQQQIAQNQLSLDDQLKERSAMVKSSGDPDQYLNELFKAQVSPSAYFGIAQQLTKTRQDQATLTKTQNENLQTAQDQIRGQLTAIEKAPDEQKQDAWTRELQSLGQNYPQLSKGLNLPQTYPGDDQIEYFQSRLALGSTLAKEASEKITAQARQLASQTGADRFAAEQNPQSPLYAPTAAAVSLGASQGQPTAQAIQSNQTQQAGNVAAVQAKAKYPYELGLEQVRQQVGQTFQNNKDAQDKIEGTVLKPYEDKMSQIGELQSAISQAQSGNVTAARGVLLKLIGVTNPDGTKRYNEAEAERLLQQGSIPQRFAGSVKNILTGNNWTPQMASDMQSFAGAQAQVATGNLNRGIDNVNKLYGTKVGSGLRQNLGGGQVQVTAPDGSVHTFPDQASADNFKKLARIQ
jgi:myosin heavy subunit